MRAFTLAEASRSSLRQCQAFFDRLGVIPTFGAEIEWYAVPEKMQLTLDAGALKDIICESVDANPLLYKNLDYLNILPQEIENTRHYQQQRGDAEATQASAIRELVHDEIHSMRLPNLALARMALVARVWRRAAEEGIVLERALDESGVVGDRQKMEISTGITHDALQMGEWIDRLRELVSEESQRLGLRADFRDRPPYTRPEFNHGKKEPGCGLHIHYGLQDNTGRNLMNVRTSDSHQDPAASMLYYATADGVLEMLHQGGFALACPSDAAFDRFRDGLHVSDAIVTGLSSEKKTAVKEIVECKIDECETLNDYANRHQEVRTPGASTPGSCAVLLASLGMAHGLAEMLELGRTPEDRKDPSRRNGGFRQNRLEAVTAEIGPLHIEKLHKLADTPIKSLSIVSRGDNPTGFHQARLMARQAAMLHAYCPEVARCIENLDGRRLS
jgi:glutamine synthetase